ncbi:nuclear transport factor 2 family protein [Parahaliea sp. F7430]|uniref:Nuclear transport factor 2 family protein n=1 Tax=Sediminihaliea albiluteola TaxID=2758564 RepID=A0A7W2TTS0_9GAMM|nr:nuclear transport factor 2 family protein [Sediminihaliea albiluteola]MBA6411834.1 nuclear transport factor 2 family protein [Sediminihaliea albiluteola]
MSEHRIDALERRLQRAEDELAIRNLVARYGMAADCGDVQSALECHLPNAVYVVSAPRSGRDSDAPDTDLEMHGHQAISDMLSSDMHQSLLPGCAHTVGPLTVDVDGDKARATGYSRLYHNNAGRPELMRLGINEWQLSRQDGRWYIAKRTSRLLSEDAAAELLQRAAWEWG